MADTKCEVIVLFPGETQSTPKVTGSKYSADDYWTMIEALHIIMNIISAHLHYSENVSVRI